MYDIRKFDALDALQTIDACSYLLAYAKQVSLTRFSWLPFKEALKHNAAAVILAHPHPSGVAEAST